MMRSRSISPSTSIRSDSDNSDDTSRYANMTEEEVNAFGSEGIWPTLTGVSWVRGCINLPDRQALYVQPILPNGGLLHLVTSWVITTQKGPVENQPIIMLGYHVSVLST
eukprot:scaffold8955_cov80-Skeletonema_dohrnii-CCMP3373.AAC.3